MDDDDDWVPQSDAEQTRHILRSTNGLIASAVNALSLLLLVIIVLLAAILWQLW